METFPVGGYCDPKFKKIESIFSEAIQTGHELGASLAIEHEGEMVVNLLRKSSLKTPVIELI